MFSATRDMSGDMRSATSPATPLSLTSLRQTASSSGGRTESCSPHAPPARFKNCEDFVVFIIAGAASKTCRVRALLRCDFALRSESAGCSCARLPAGLRLGAGPFASRHSQSQFFGI
jgi:hypothetical protein